MRELAPQQYKIEKISSSVAVIDQRFSEEGRTHITIANRTLAMQEVKNIGQPSQTFNLNEWRKLVTGTHR